MVLDIEDGYTLDGATEERVCDAAGTVIYYDLPVVTFRYRPALPEALASWRYTNRRANTGKEEVASTAAFLCEHLVSWDVIIGGKPAPINPATVAKIPEPILDQITRIVAKWAPKAATELGNSPAA